MLFKSSLPLSECTTVGPIKAKIDAALAFVAGSGYEMVKFNGTGDGAMRALRKQLSQALTKTNGLLAKAFTKLVHKQVLVNFATKSMMLFTTQSVSTHRFNCDNRAQIFPCHIALDGQWQAPPLGLSCVVHYLALQYYPIFLYSYFYYATHMLGLCLTCANPSLQSLRSVGYASKAGWHVVEVVVAAASRFDKAVSDGEIGMLFIDNQFGTATTPKQLKLEYPLQLLMSDSSYCMTVLLEGDSKDLTPTIANVRHSLEGKQLHFI